MRPIDADALFKEFERTAWYNNADRDEIAEEMLLQMPTIDAVPVVRCKDCKYYEIHRPKVLENCERNGHLIPMSPDDFCSYGERRSDG